MARRKKRQLSIFAKLVISYVIFALTLLVIFAAFIIMAFFISTDNDISRLDPYSIIDESNNFSEESLDTIVGYGGWVEVLDSDLNVVEVYGDPKTEKMKYSNDELFALTSTDTSENLNYIGFLTMPENTDSYYLVIYNRSDVEHTVTFNFVDNENLILSWVLPLMFLAIFILLCFILGLYLSKRINKPLKAMTNAMARVESGDQGVRLDIKTEAEFAVLRDSFNTMISSLEEQKQINAENEEKKNRMLLELSHDIRTPIATINSCALALSEGLVKPEKQNEYYKIISTKANRVSDLSDNMFTLLKMDSDDYKLSQTSDNICEFIRLLCAEYYDEVESVGLEFIINIPDEPIFLLADYHLLTRAFDNLIENAIKYNKTGKNILVFLAKEEENVIIKIADDGAPIEAEIRDTMFEIFSRGDMARKTDGGTGLGLSIAKTIIEKHKGKITYEYKDRKNVFSVSLKISDL